MSKTASLTDRSNESSFRGFTEPTTAPARAFLAFSIGFTMVAALGYLGVLALLAPGQPWRLLVVSTLFLVAGAAWWLLRQQRMEAAVATLAVGLWIYVTITSYFYGGVDGTSIIVYVPIILLVGWQIGARAAVFSAAATLVATLVLLALQMLGRLPPLPPTPPAARWIPQAVVFVLSAGLMVSAVRSYRDRLREVHRLSLELEQRTSDLHRAQAVAHIGSWVYDLVTDTMYLSAETCRIFGLPEGTKGSRAAYISRMHPDDRETAEAAWDAAVQTHVPLDNEHRILIGKRIRWIRQRAEIEYLADGTPVRSVGTTQDITDLREAEQSLRFVRAGVETASDALFWADFQGRIVDVNPEACRSLGYTREELLTMQVSAILLPSRAEQLPPLLAKLRERGSAKFESEHVTKDGRILQVEVAFNRVAIGRDEYICAFARDITERKRAESMLREKETQLEGVLASTGDGILAVGRDGRTILANRRFAEIAQLPPSAFESADDRALRAQVVSRMRDPEGFTRKVEALYDSDLESNDIVEFLDGRVYERFTSPLILGGENVGRVWSFRDVTERAHAERALEESRNLLRLVIDTAPVRVFWKDRDLRYLGCNPAFARDAGRSVPEDVVGKFDYELAWADQASAYRADDRAVIDSGVPKLSYDERQTAPDGRPLWLRTSKVPLRSHDGTVIGVLGVYEDITERKNAEEALREGQQRLEAVFNASAIGISISRMDDGTVLEVNQAALDIYGYERDEALGRTVFDLGIYPDLAERQAFVDVLRRGGTVDRRPVKLRRSNGEIRDVDYSVRAIDLGGQRCLVVMMLDVTETKRLEQESLQAQKLASLGTLAGGIAHDFNNILAAIRGNAELAGDEIGSGHPASEALAEVRRASTRAAELVRRIMAFARPTETRHDAIDLAVVVTEVLKLLRSTLPASIELRTAFAADAPHVLADTSQVHEAIVNLTTNAAHAIGNRPGTVSYELDAVTIGESITRGLPGLSPGRYARLTVVDDGCGMDAETLRRIFDVFYTTKPVGEGTGLGLSMVHGIMRSHNGAVTADSAPGRGATFALYFPAAERVRARAEAASVGVERAVVSRRVLFVDDEQALVTLSSRVLERLGHVVDGFTDPRAALEHFAGHADRYDVVITDLSMPHMSGFDVARAVIARRPDLPVLMTTGFVRVEDEAVAHEIGIRRLVLKPFSVGDLGRAFAELYAD